MEEEVSKTIIREIGGLNPCVKCGKFNIRQIVTPMAWFAVECRRCGKKTRFYNNSQLATDEWNKMNPLKEGEKANG